MKNLYLIFCVVWLLKTIVQIVYIIIYISLVAPGENVNIQVIKNGNIFNKVILKDDEDKNKPAYLRLVCKGFYCEAEILAYPEVCLARFNSDTDEVLSLSFNLMLFSIINVCFQLFTGEFPWTLMLVLSVASWKHLINKDFLSFLWLLKQ